MDNIHGFCSHIQAFPPLPLALRCRYSQSLRLGSKRSRVRISSLVCSFICSFIHSFIRSFVRSFILAVESGSNTELRGKAHTHIHIYSVLTLTLMPALQKSIYCCREHCKPRAPYTHRLRSSLVWERCSSKAPSVHRIPHITLGSMLLNEALRPREQRPHNAKALGIRVWLWERLLEALKDLSSRLFRNTHIHIISLYVKRQVAGDSNSLLLSSFVWTFYLLPRREGFILSYFLRCLEEWPVVSS